MKNPIAGMSEKKTSGTEVAAAEQWQGQQHLLFPSVSVVLAEPHLADPKFGPQRGGHLNSCSYR